MCVCVCVCKGGGNNRRPPAFAVLSAAGSPSHPVCSGFKPFLVRVTYLASFLRRYARISQRSNQIFAHCLAFIIRRRRCSDRHNVCQVEGLTQHEKHEKPDPSFSLCSEPREEQYGGSSDIKGNFKPPVIVALRYFGLGIGEEQSSQK